MVMAAENHSTEEVELVRGEKARSAQADRSQRDSSLRDPARQTAARKKMPGRCARVDKQREAIKKWQTQEPI